MIDDATATEDPLGQIVAGAVTALTFLVGFGLLAAGVSHFWIAFPVGFGGVLPAALGAVRLYQRRQASDDEEEPIDALRRRYAEGDLTEAEFERQVEQLLETESDTVGERVHTERDPELE